MDDLNSIIGLSSNVDVLLEEDNCMRMNERLRELENLDKVEEYKQTIEYINILAYYCEECKRVTEYMNPYCKQEGHRINRRNVKKESHVCINESCKYRFFSLDGIKPLLCPKCRESTIISEKTSFYKPRPDYLMPNETLLDCEVGAYRPRDANS